MLMLMFWVLMLMLMLLMLMLMLLCLVCVLIVTVGYMVWERHVETVPMEMLLLMMLLSVIDRMHDAVLQLVLVYTDVQRVMVMCYQVRLCLVCVTRPMQVRVPSMQMSWLHVRM